MNTIRNISLIVLGIIVSFVMSHYGVGLAALIFVPPFLIWFALWDEKNIVKVFANSLLTIKIHGTLTTNTNRSNFVTCIFFSHNMVFPF